jgi:hypothetical protein
MEHQDNDNKDVKNNNSEGDKSYDFVPLTSNEESSDDLDPTPTPTTTDESSHDGSGEDVVTDPTPTPSPTPSPTPTTDPIAELELKLTELEGRINSVSGSVGSMKPLLDRNVALLFPSGHIGNNYRYGGIFHAFNSRIRQLDQRLKQVENQVRNNTHQINRNRNSIAHNAHNIAINVRDIASNLAKINIIKYIDSYWNKKIDGPYEPQLPYIINRKNTAYDYHIEIFVATDKYINGNLNRHGNNGWMLVHMSVVDEYIGTARFIFKKLRTPVGNVRFNYICLRYENFWPENFTRLLRSYNEQGYDYSFESPFTQSYTVALLTKIIY